MGQDDDVPEAEAKFSLADSEPAGFSELQGISSQVDSLEPGQDGWEHQYEFQPGKSAQPDYDFQTPGATTDEGGVTQVDSLTLKHGVVEGGPDEPGALLEGDLLTPEDTGAPSSGEYVVTSVEHSASQSSGGLAPELSSGDQPPPATNDWYTTRPFVQLGAEDGPADALPDGTSKTLMFGEKLQAQTADSEASGGAKADDALTPPAASVDPDTETSGAPEAPGFDGKLLSAQDLTSEGSSAADAPVIPGKLEYPNLSFHLPDADPVDPTPETGGSQGFGFVTFGDAAEAAPLNEAGLRSDGELVQAVDDGQGPPVRVESLAINEEAFADEAEEPLLTDLSAPSAQMMPMQTGDGQLVQDLQEGDIDHESETLDEL
jgi:hypothetical protein